MSNPAVIRGGGLAAILAGVLFAVWGYIHRDNAPAHYTVVANTLAFIVPMLFLFGLAGLCSRCREQAGWLGLMGFGLGCIASTEGIVRAGVDMTFWYAYVPDKGWLYLILDWLSLLLISLTLLGIATIRTKVVRRWGGLLLSMGILGWAYCLTDSGGVIETRPWHIAFGMLFSLSWMILGYSLYWSVGAAKHDVTKRTG
jgi:hypothetical protein